jgi:DNA-binding GntR family transcriptional regulator
MNPARALLVKKNRGITLVDEITTALRRLILDGDFPPGMRLVELDLAARTGGSQGSVREALQRLERDGFVVRNGRRGTFVTEVSLRDLHEIFLVRSVVESASIRRTGRWIRDDQLEELRSLHASMWKAGQEGDAVALVEHDMAFHERICLWANHSTLPQTWTLLCAQIERCLVRYDKLHFPDLVDVADLHVPIIEALAARNPDLAAELIEKHVMLGAPPPDYGESVSSQPKKILST